MSGRKTLNIACLLFHFVPSSRYPLLQGHLYDPKILAQEALWWHRYPAYEHSFWSKHEKPLPWKPDLHLHIRPFPCKPSLHEHVYEPSLLLQVAVELQSPKPFRNSSTSWQTWPSSENLELQVLLRDPKVLMHYCAFASHLWVPFSHSSTSWHKRPSPRKPALHEQLKEPTVILHWAKALELWI